VAVEADFLVVNVVPGGLNETFFIPSPKAKLHMSQGLAVVLLQIIAASECNQHG
jgi:hypothetical protein